MADALALPRRRLLSAGVLGVAAVAGCTSRDSRDSDNATQFGYGGVPAEAAVENSTPSDPPEQKSTHQRTTDNEFYFPEAQASSPDLEYDGEDYGVVGYGEQGYGGAEIVEDGASERA